MSEKLSKRRRVSSRRFTDDMMDSQEERMLHIALENSKVETQQQYYQSPPAKVFYPSKEEFLCPIAYIESIREEAERTGICKIVPPKGWKPKMAVDLNGEATEFPTKLQKIHSLQEGKHYDDGTTHTFKSYQAKAREFEAKWYETNGWKNPKSSEELEQAYWKIVETSHEQLSIEYANDLDTTTVGSGFDLPMPSKQMFSIQPLNLERKCKKVELDKDCYYRNCGWNLNNLPQWAGSLLRHIRTPINGVNVPWLYCGMLFATFCWHTEDNYLYSINYMHHGAKKRWYGVPRTDAEKFEKVMKKSVPLRFREDPDLLFHLVTMISPTTLHSKDVEVYSVLQEPGEIIITFPKAYHGGYSEGFNCNEAVNFALPDWIQYGRECNERYRRFGRLSVFSHDRLMCILTKHLDEMTESSAEALLEDLKLMQEEERYMRKQLESSGIKNVINMPSNSYILDERTMREDDRRQCYACKHSCYFSGIVCSCSSQKISCLRHLKDFCKCSDDEKLLLIWTPMSEMEALILSVENYLETFKDIKEVKSEATK